MNDEKRQKSSNLGCFWQDRKWPIIEEENNHRTNRTVTNERSRRRVFIIPPCVDRYHGSNTTQTFLNFVKPMSETLMQNPKARFKKRICLNLENLLTVNLHKRTNVAGVILPTTCTVYTMSSLVNQTSSYGGIDTKE